MFGLLTGSPCLAGLSHGLSQKGLRSVLGPEKPPHVLSFDPPLLLQGVGTARVLANL